MTVPDDTLAGQVRRFRAWAATDAGTYGEWECDYDQWDALYAAVRATLEKPTQSDADVELMLYALARDNESELIRGALEDHPEHVLRLAQAASPGSSEPDARWQLGLLLGERADPRAIALLRALIDDPDEYVRRRALLAAVANDPAHAEQMAWARLQDSFEYTRLVALSVLRDTRSARLAEAVLLLRDDPSAVVQDALRRPQDA